MSQRCLLFVCEADCNKYFNQGVISLGGRRKIFLARLEMGINSYPEVKRYRQSATGVAYAIKYLS